MPLIALTLAFACIAWGLVLLRHGSVLGMATTMLVAGIFAGPPLFSIDGPMQISIDRVLWAGLLGLSFVHWKLGWTSPKPLTRGDWIVIGFCLITLLSSLRGGPLPEDEHQIARWLFYVAMPTGIFFVTRNASLSMKDLRTVCYVLTGVGCYVAITAILEVSGAHSLVFPRYIVDPKAIEFLGRARGPLMNPAANGVLLTTCIGATLASYRHSGSGIRRVLAVILSLELLGALATLTRCVWMGVIVFLGLMIWLTLSRYLRFASIIAVLVLGVTAGPFAVKSLAVIKRDKHLSPQASLESVMLRPLLGVIALEMFKERPLTGHGFGRYLVHHKEYVHNPRWQMPLKTAIGFVQHNIVLSILVDCGLVGCAFYLGMLGWWTWIAMILYLRSDQPEKNSLGQLLIAALIGYGVNGMFQDATIFQNIHLLLMFLAGLAVNLTWPQKDLLKPTVIVDPDRSHEHRQTKGQLLFPGTTPTKGSISPSRSWS